MRGHKMRLIDRPSVKKMTDFEDGGSFLGSLRRKRFSIFLKLVEGLPKPVRVLDIGGTTGYWKAMGYDDPSDIEVTLANLDPQEVTKPNFRSVVSDAANLREFGDKEFDVAFSNSVIEHLGTLDRQQAMAEAVFRVAKRYYLQTPNFWFPIEPHFLFPGFQFLPLSLRVGLLKRMNLGWVMKKENPDNECAVWSVGMTPREFVASIRLLSGKELKALFPGATIHREKILGLTKSFILTGDSR